MKTVVNTSFFLILLSACFVSGRDIDLTWNAVTADTSGNPETGIIYYNIYCDTIPSFSIQSSTFLASTRNTSYTHSGAADNKDYFYLIQAVDEYGNSSQVSPAEGTIPFVLTELRIFLGGVYDQQGDSMKTDLAKKHYIPLESPYPQAPRRVLSVPETIVDWILVELRAQSDPGTPVVQQSFFLNSQGRIVELDGSNAILGIPNSAEGNYYMVIRHRNHLAVMTALSQELLKTTATTYDFTDSMDKYYLDGGEEIETGVFASIAGDANANGEIQNDDKNDFWRLQVGLSGYYNSDFNLNGDVQNDDKNDIWRIHAGIGTRVP